MYGGYSHELIFMPPDLILFILRIHNGRSRVHLNDTVYVTDWMDVLDLLSAFCNFWGVLSFVMLDRLDPMTSFQLLRIFFFRHCSSIIMDLDVWIKWFDLIWFDW